ncbi:complement receptor type 2-like [Myxocyprinus asiaticus]|uniref:complement receptor type 2-like n=1 Tax=Myxocyprinus asiaticus TaxID=70543 RepID=UPI00222161A0|nr:complement receptor type 2-like [Myxocyprinus asiaticus]
MKVLYILLLAQLSFQLQCDKTMIQATIGSSFTIVCTYKSNQFRFSKKYWCSGHSRDTCEVLMHTDGFTHAGYRQRAKIIDRFSKGLIVFIKDLQLDDTGIYWVGIDKIYADIMLRIQVTVTKEAVMKPKVWPLSSPEMTCWGQPVVFRCKSERGTDVQYTWYRVGHPNNIVLDHATDIHFHCSKITEDSQFFCSASNNISSQNSESVSLQLLQPAEKGCVYLITSKTLTSYDCIRSTTPPSTTIKTTEKFWSSARHQTLYINQTWKESYFPWSWSWLPLWYECLRWLLSSTMVTISCVVYIYTKSNPRRVRTQAKHHKEIFNYNSDGKKTFAKQALFADIAPHKCCMLPGLCLKLIFLDIDKMGCKVLCLSVVAFIICVMKGEHVRAQCTQPRFGENVILSDQFILTNSFSDGSTVTFVCVPGYKPVDSKASRSVTCSGNRWTDLALNCTRKSCGSLADFSHGRYEIPNGILFGDTVTAVCDKGYMLSGRESQRTCRAEGVWDGRDPVCEAVKCPPPPVVENGQLEDVPLESYEYLQAVTYKCNSGFTLVGNAELHCSEDGTFQPAPPKCFDGCPKPEIPHSVRTGGKSPPYKLNHFIEYKCETGYKMDGNGYIVCTENGWNPKPSECTAQCTQPRFGENVILSDQFILTNSFSDGSTVTFECVPGYKPVDSKASRSVTCSGNRWTDLALNCTRKSCGSLADFSHGRYEIPNGILFGDTVTAVCDKGYMLSGRESQRTCRAQGVWDGRDPVCEAVKCPPPPVVENGQLEDVPLESYEYLQAVTYKCNSGFTLVGNAELHCSEDGTFQPAPPKCFDGCPKPEIPHSVRTGGKSPPYKLNHFIEYKCETGYKMDGNGYIVCTENGWNPEPSECTAVKCPPPPVVENGQLKDVPLESYEYLQAVTYKCNSGFTLIGNAELHCSEDGTFQPAPPKCVAMKCPPPPVVENGQLKDVPLESYEYSQAVTYKCNSGFTLIGNAELHCSEDGTFQPAPPKCVAVKCPPPPVVENGQLKDVPLESYEYSQAVTYKCNSGFTLIGNAELHCSEDGTFQPAPPKCVVQCSKPRFGGNVILSDEFHSTVSFPNGSTVTFECISGYEPVNSTASKSVSCVEKQWTDLQLICIGTHNPTPDAHHRTPVYVIVLSVLGVIAVAVLGVTGGYYYVKQKKWVLKA